MYSIQDTQGSIPVFMFRQQKTLVKVGKPCCEKSSHFQHVLLPVSLPERNTDYYKSLIQF